MMRSEHKFCVGVDEKLFNQGLIVPVYIDFNKTAHLLLTGSTGSGKTTLLKYILQQLALLDGQLILADFKGIDFRSMQGCKNYYQHTAVGDSLDRVFQELQNRMSNPTSDFSPLFYVVDEWSGYLGLLNKKEQDQRKQQLASILMLGRGAGPIFLILALQRADSAYISGRDNFGNRIGLGRLSPESIKMIFEDNDIILPKKRGRGYLRIDGMQAVRDILVPKLRNETRTMRIIHDGLDR